MAKDTTIYPRLATNAKHFASWLESLAVNAPDYCDSLTVLEWDELKGRVIETAKLWKVIDECATYLGKRHIQDAMYSADFIEFAGLSGEIHEFSGDILEALSTEEAVKRCRKKSNHQTPRIYAGASRKKPKTYHTIE